MVNGSTIVTHMEENYERLAELFLYSNKNELIKYLLDNKYGLVEDFTDYLNTDFMKLCEEDYSMRGI